MKHKFNNGQTVLIDPLYHIPMWGKQLPYDVIGKIKGIVYSPIVVIESMWIVEVKDIPGYDYDCLIIPEGHLEACEKPQMYVEYCKMDCIDYQIMVPGVIKMNVFSRS
jgi:hypothetical protein